MSQKKNSKKIKKVKKGRYGIFLWAGLLLVAGVVAVFSFFKIAAALAEYRAGEKAYEKASYYTRNNVSSMWFSLLEKGN